MDPAEIEFLAESATSIGIVPNFSEGTLYLLEGDVGPFRAGQPLQVGRVAVILRIKLYQKLVLHDLSTQI